MTELHRDSPTRYTLVSDNEVFLLNLLAQLTKWRDSPHYGFCVKASCDVYEDGRVHEGQFTFDALPIEGDC